MLSKQLFVIDEQRSCIE